MKYKFEIKDFRNLLLLLVFIIEKYDIAEFLKIASTILYGKRNNFWGPFFFLSHNTGLVGCSFRSLRRTVWYACQPFNRGMYINTRRSFPGHNGAEIFRVRDFVARNFGLAALCVGSTLSGLTFCHREHNNSEWFEMLVRKREREREREGERFGYGVRMKLRHYRGMWFRGKLAFSFLYSIFEG